MRATRSEQALRRILAWLRWNGQALGPQLEQAALQALSEALSAGEADLFGASLRRLEARGVLRQERSARLPHAGISAPPLRRSSISYGGY